MCADHTFKTMKSIRQGQEQRFEAMHSIMNEYAQICSSIFVESTGMEKCLVQARMFYERYIELGLEVSFSILTCWHTVASL
jgi:hypothetical protein